MLAMISGFFFIVTMFTQSHKTAETVAPQHGIGAQYLDPSPYVAGVPVSPGVLQVSAPPVLATPEQVQIQVGFIHRAHTQ